MRSRRVRSTGALLFTLLFGACTTTTTSWQRSTMPVRSILEEERADPVRFQISDGSVIEMERPTLVGDAVTGTTRCAVPAADARACSPGVTSARSIQLADIRAVDVLVRNRRTDVKKTTLVIVGGVVVGVGLIWWAIYDTITGAFEPGGP